MSNTKWNALADGVSRRRMMAGGAGLVGAGMLAPGALAIGSADLFPEAETEHGKVRGIHWTGVHAFLGVPYGRSTSGDNRWRAPRAPASWRGVRDCFEHGEISPQRTTDRNSDYSSLIMWDRQVGGMGEDMLHVNIWTQGLKDGGKRPVLVCFHGGGYTTGSGNAPGFDGDPLVRSDDVVVVTVTHRLGALGYINLVDVGASKSKYGEAGCVGLLDLVASLKWIQTNIENFGGDPERVFFFGQSGGGAKASCVYSMPAAKGAFSRAAVQSGSALRGRDRDAAAETTLKLMDELNISRSRPERLVDVPWDKLLAAQLSIEGAFSPVVMEESSFARHPFDPDAPPASRDVPLIVSYTADDAAIGLTNWDAGADDIKKLFAQRFGGAQNAETIYAAYRAEYPTVTPYLIEARAFTDSRNARSVDRQLELKAAQEGGAPCYKYIFEWKAPGMDGKFGAVHGIDVALCMNNPRGPLEGGAGSEARLMARRLSSAWVAFAKTGNPNSAEIPDWPEWDPERRVAMLFNTNTRAVARPHAKLAEMWSTIDTGS